MAKTYIAQLQSLSEEVLGKAAQNPTAARVLEAAAQLRDRVDDLTKRVRGLEALEARLDALEQRVDELDKPRRKTSAKKTEDAAESSS